MPEGITPPQELVQAEMFAPNKLAAPEAPSATAPQAVVEKTPTIDMGPPLEKTSFPEPVLATIPPAQISRTENSIAAPPAEAFNGPPFPPDAEIPKKGLGDVLNQAREAGQQKRVETTEGAKRGGAEWRAALAQRVGQARELALNAWKGIKEFGGKWKAETTKYADIGIGVATSREAQAAMMDYMREKVDDSKDLLKTKYMEIDAQAMEKSDAAVGWCGDKMRGLAKGVNEGLIQPNVKRAMELGKGLLRGGENVVNFFQRQGEKSLNTIGTKQADIMSGWYGIMAAPAELKAGLLGKLGEKITNYSHGDRDIGLNNRAHQTEHRAKAAVLRPKSYLRPPGATAGAAA